MNTPAEVKRTPEEAWALVEKYDPLIRGQASRWPGLEREDHEQELRMAVYRAALTFDSEKCKDFAQWARGYMKACSARQPLTVLDTTYHLADQQRIRKNPSRIPNWHFIKSTSEKLRHGDERTYEDILASSAATLDEALSEARDYETFRSFVLSQVDEGRIRTGLEHYLQTNGDSLAGSAREVGVSRQRLSLVFIEALREWQARSRA